MKKLAFGFDQMIVYKTTFYQQNTPKNFDKFFCFTVAKEFLQRKKTCILTSNRPTLNKPINATFFFMKNVF